MTGVFVAAGWEVIFSMLVVLNGFDSDTIGSDDLMGKLNGSVDVDLNEHSTECLGWVDWEGELNIGSELDLNARIGLGDKSGDLGMGESVDSVDCKRTAETGVGLEASFGGG